MLNTLFTTAAANDMDIIAFSLRGQEFCVETTKVREIRGWVNCTPVPHSPADVLGVINLRGEVVPIIDLAGRLGMGNTLGTERSAIVVAEVGREVFGLLVDSVSDILTVQSAAVQPMPDAVSSKGPTFATGMLTLEQGMICLLNLPQLLGASGAEPSGAREHDLGLPTCH